MIAKKSGILRFFKVIGLFIHITLAFYSLKYKKYLHHSGWQEKKREELYVSQARLFCNTAVELEGLLIKLGQFISTRVDLLPESSIKILSELQDEVKAVEFEDIKMLAEKELQSSLDDIFEYFNPQPIAAASLGQVHYARLKDGREAAVKIMRPGIEHLVIIDLKAIKQVIGLVKLFTNWERFIDLDAIYLEFKETLWDELDYLKEGRNAEAIAANCADDQELLIPQIIWEFTRRRVLTMQYMQGIKINDYKQLEAAGINGQKLSAHLLSLYIQQILIHGFYHADPHPGNLFVSEDGKLIMLDFGMVGSISSEMRKELVNLVKAMVRRDYHTVVDYLVILGFVHHRADRTTLTRAVGVFLEHILGGYQELSSIDLNNFLKDFEKLLYEQPFQVPARFTFLGRALGIIYGICIGLDPKINFIETAKPYVDEFLGEGGSIYQVVKEKAKVLGSALIEIPPLLERVLQKTDLGDISIKISTSELTEVVRDNTRSVRSLTWAIIFGFSLLSSVYLLVNHITPAAYWGFAFTAICFIFTLSNSRPRRHRRRAPHPPAGVKRN